MSELITFNKGDVIFTEGQAADSLFFIAGPVDAKIGIYKKYQSSDEVKLTTLLVDSFLGEIALSSDGVRTATAIAETEVTLEKISVAEFSDYAKSNRAKFYDILVNSTKRLRSLTKEYLIACGTLSDYVKTTEAGEKPDEDLIKKIQAYV